MGTTSAVIVLAACIQVLEAVVTPGAPLLTWCRENIFQTVLFILVVDQAAYNGLAYKFLLCLQLLLLPSLNLLLWLGPCGLHQGVRILVGHLDRCDHSKLLRACSRSLRQGKNHDKLCEVIPRVVEFRARFHMGAPPYVDVSAKSEVKDLLLNLMLFSDRQRCIGSKDPEKKLNESRRKFHLTSIFALLNFTLIGDELIHYCSGNACCPRGITEYKEKLSYHLVCIMEDGIPKFMPTRFTKINGTSCFICPLQCFAGFGATALKVAFKKNVEEAIETIKNAKDVTNDPLADINWTSNIVFLIYENITN